MDQVGINGGPVAGMVFFGEKEEAWPIGSAHYRLYMMRERRDSEQGLTR